MLASHEKDSALVEADRCPEPNCGSSRIVEARSEWRLMAGAGVKDLWIASAKRCVSCGCVFTMSQARPVVRGYFYPTVGAWLPPAKVSNFKAQ